MNSINQKINSFLSKNQNTFLVLGILIVFLLIVLTMLSWYMLLKLSLVQEKTDAIYSEHRENIDQPEETKKEYTKEEKMEILSGLSNNPDNLSLEERRERLKSVNSDAENTLTKEEKLEILNNL